ncbi:MULTISPECIES: Bug family tripartite tricarboxylate transporter substrate binding protein [Ramlibacter]|uniref:Tripartite tricarboxylate transporter substrate binding protein n=1 Tax=Ramlibacter pinisoli TaxID=2682844 RepID=A0A6N8IYZ9_9BURK|nr:MULTISPECIES: tripartite tricarboxylate transporter substrate binding protein [Ramlibacter]MBA2962272.1 tripartite tricarboxylate transporter substrate binding protein [Ramlibacter sp. CGMCC 1.13660]MVQ32214.1 tripartite tricarboxylate transporter substrate binding protein [Ramlibacter pinisoli]
MTFNRTRRGLTALAALLALGAGVAQAQTDFPSRPIELVVPFQPGGGTDALARSFADASRKHMPQSMIIVNKPGASGSIGWQDVAAAKPDGYRLAVITVELATLPHMGIGKISYEDLQPIAQLNADPAAITVRADAPWNTIEEFLAAAKKDPGKIGVANAGNGSIWHLAAAALEEKTGVKFNHVPFQGAGPGVLALLGGHVDAAAVSPAEVSTYVAAGKLKTLAVMADQRVKGFDKVPTLKERKIDLSIGTWRGIAAPKNTPPEVVAYLKKLALNASSEPAFRETLDKQNLGFVYADDAAFKAVIARDNAYFKSLITKLGIKN